jgi:glycosyltransferase involved in cell wall biosynthesis
MTPAKKLISIIVPAYNEEACVEELARRISLVFDANTKYDFEAIIIENGSVDRTWELLQQIHHRDSRFKIVQLARNFRMDGGLTAGLHYARGDAAVLMTADLQDPPELITEFIKRWEEGFENVYMVVTKRRGTGPIRRFNSRAFYWLAGKLTDNRIPANASDFRLVDRKVYETVRSMEERNRFVRGLFAWVGFRSIGIEAERPERFGGVSNAHSFKVIDLAFKGIFSHSYVPLKLITVTGLLLSAVSFVAMMTWALAWIFIGVPFAGFGTLVSLALLALGFLSFMLGLVAEYVGLIYEEVKARPNFVVQDTLGL